ncbi:DEAD/DEAH box helicase [Peptoniphilus harei]|uniref:DEAD-box ATP-dependent RNA helicase CshA n=1 Tax=Peptoniphilus harei TaxID=54005 RepID=A0A2X1YLE8_9FIRM|nr:DEAD/DEAH box helicase [Peptoniphilus harei]QQT90721.1 DEAD/DEAH box helicase [Peptoniphilus harei]SPY48331.1 DEAD-box ATP-dependent RNA helicase CshA [Peptoniphilus harei]
MRFSDLNLSSELLHAIDDLGFESPSEVQEASIPIILEGRDVLAQAQTGTGKTASFGIPIIEGMEENAKDLQALVLVPTRELARQVSEELKKLAKYKKFINIVPIYGGADMGKQLRDLKRGASIVVGTPGRVMDHMKRKTIRLDGLKFLTFDEADEMFDMGFRDDMKTIIERTNPNRQTLFFSATFDNDIREFSRLYQRDPAKVIIEKKELTAEKIEQFYLELNRNMKTEILNRLILIHKPKKSIIFCNTKRMVEALEVEIAQRGYKVDSLHGDMRQSSRDNVMKKFRKGTIDVLIATDVAARGLDVSDIDLVFNYDLPQQAEYYVHRIGRTARAGKKGASFTFVTSRDYPKFKEIEKYANIKMEKMKLPTKADVERESLDNLFDKVNKNILKAEDQANYTEVLNKLLAEGHSLYDISASLLKLVNESTNKTKIKELDRVDYGKKFEMSKKSKSSDRSRDKRGKEMKKIKGPKIFINKGKRDGLDSREVIRLLGRHTDINPSDIGRINIMPNFSFVEVPKNMIKDAIRDLDGKKIKGKSIKAEYSEK